MIRRVLIHNLVLVEECCIEIGPGFNVFTGETGAGKTAFTEGVALCLGERASTDLIRKGCDKAFVEITIDPTPTVLEKLETIGICCQEELIIRRELLSSGKSRAFINSQTVPLPFLQQIGKHLVDTISQHSTYGIRLQEYQRELIDQFGSLQEDLFLFQKSYTEQLDIQKKKEELEALLQDKEKRESMLTFQLEELGLADFKEGEEEALLAEHEKFSSSQKLLEGWDKWRQELARVLLQLGNLQKLTTSKLFQSAPFNEAASLLQEALIPLKESAHLLDSLDADTFDNPKRAAYVEERLSLMHRLKRKYGKSVEEIVETKLKLQEQLNQLETLAEEIQEVERLYQKIQTQVASLAEALTKKRKASAALLSEKLSEELHKLNMEKAEVSIHIIKTEHSLSGQDEVQFWIQANPGENPSLVKEHASGGELARLLFAIKIVLADKNATPTLIFDEIDANVGGRTAKRIAEKLKTLGQSKQVLCITHFPQVAVEADCHFQVIKQDKGMRTVTQIEQLCPSKIQEELLRMGGHSPSPVRN
ncbi:MAG: repair protein recN [Chlamydiota bacterium]|jgi:DNA repair protein RecN (Recombination protein N)